FPQWFDHGQKWLTEMAYKVSSFQNLKRSHHQIMLTPGDACPCEHGEPCRRESPPRLWGCSSSWSSSGAPCNPGKLRWPGRQPNRRAIAQLSCEGEVQPLA